MGHMCFGVVFWLVFVAPIFFEFNSSIFGSPGDSTAGGIWHAYAFSEMGFPPWQSWSQISGALLGEPFWRPIYWGSSLVFLPLWALAQFLPPVAAWNLLTVLGPLITSIFMLLLLSRFTNWRPARFVLSTSVAYSPFVIQKIGGHIAYVNQVPLILAVGIALIPLSSRIKTLLVIVVALLSALSDAYYLLMILMIFGASSFVDIYNLLKDSNFKLFKRILSQYLGLIAVTFAISLVLLSGTDTSIQSRTTNTMAEISTYAARPMEYLRFDRHHPVYEFLRFSPPALNLHGSNLSETTIYLGIPLLLMGLLSIFFVIQKKNLDGIRLVCIFLFLTLCSFPPNVVLFGVRIPAPSNLIGRLFPGPRVYSRLFEPILICLVLLVALFIDQLRSIKFRSLSVGKLFLPLLVIVIFFDYQPFSRREVWSFREFPSTLYALKSEPNIRKIAYLPFDFPPYTDGNAATIAGFVEVPMLNQRLLGTENSKLFRGLSNITASRFWDHLANAGVSHVVITEDLAQEIKELPNNVELIAQDGVFRLYRIEFSSSQLPFLMMTGPDIPIEWNSGSPFYWSKEQSLELALSNFSLGDLYSREVTVTFKLIRFGRPGYLVLKKNSETARKIWVSSTEFLTQKVKLSPNESLQILDGNSCLTPAKLVAGSQDNRILCFGISDWQVD